MRVAMGYATATLALTSCSCSSTAASSASRSSGKAAEALAGPAHRQRLARWAQYTSFHVPSRPIMTAQSAAANRPSFG